MILMTDNDIKDDRELPKVNPLVSEKVGTDTVSAPKTNFFKKHKLSLIIIGLIIVAVVAIFCVVPVISIDKLKLVNFGASVKLESGETVKLKGGNVFVKINNFSNTACPSGRKCFGSGSTVEYQLTVDGQNYATGTKIKAAGSKFQVETVSSDYKTYAIVKIVDSK